MPKFYIREVFEIPNKQVFVLAGSTTEGEIRPGMLVQIPLNSQMGIIIPIQSIETERRGDRDELCLHLSLRSDEIETLRALDMTDELCEVLADEGKGSNAT